MTNQPTVYEQQLIRDQGQEFRIRMRQAIKSFDSLVNPLRFAIRNLIKEILKETIQAESDDSLINNFYYKYFTRFEDQHFRFSLQCLNFIFDSETTFNFNEDLNYKYIAIIYQEQLRNYFKEQNDKVLNRVWEKLNSLKKQKENDEIEEGFWDGLDTENCSQKSKKQNAKNDPSQQNQNEFCHTRKELQLKDMLIQSLQAKLIQRESNLVQITSGYLKELQSLREQLFRKEQTILSPDDLFEVTFMDFTEVLDPDLKKLFTAHTNDLKLQFNNKIIDCHKLIQAQKDEIRNYKIQIQQLNQKLNTIEGPSEILKKVFGIDSNPYRIWKYIADLKGNFFFKEVFEQQRAVYGINYQELNQLLLTNKAYEREYQSYKEIVQQEQIVFFEKIQSEVEELTKQLIRVNLEKQQLINSKESDKEVFIKIASTYYDQRICKEVEIVKENFNNQLLNMNQSLANIDKLKVKFAFKLWVAMYKRHKNEDLKQLLSQVQFFDDKLISNNEQIKELQKKLTFEKEANIQLLAKISHLELIAIKYEKETVIYKKELENAKSYIGDLQLELKQNQQAYSLTQSFCTKILRMIDPRLASLKINDIDLDCKSKEVVKSIMTSIKNLNQKSLRAIAEVRQQGLINKEAYEILIQKIQRDKETQTDIEPENKNKKMKTLDSEDGSKRIKSSIHKTSNSVCQDDAKPQKNNNVQNQKVDNQKEKPKLIVKQSEDDINENKKNIEEQSTNLSPLKVLKNFDFKQQGSPQSENKKSKKPTPQNQFQEYQEFQSEQVIQLLEVSEQVEQEQNRAGDKTSQQKQKMTNRSLNIPQQDVYSKKESSSQRSNYHTSQQSRKQNERQKSLSIQQTASARNSKSFRIKTPNQPQISKTPDAFQKLYDDGFKKSERIKNLKDNLESLEKSHWNEILDLFSRQTSGNYILNDLIPPKVQEQSFSFLETESFQKMCYKKYYNQTKSKAPNKPNYRSWIMRQTNCIDQMFNTLKNMDPKKQEQQEYKIEILNSQTLVADKKFIGSIKSKV